MTTAKTTTNRQDIERYIRVDHAGERAAQQIYRGQLVVLDKHPMGEEIRHMMAQEVEHLETFDSLINERRVRPSLLDPLWGAAGFALGVVTAAMGPKAAMACTIAVEEVIGEHYQKQAENLGEDEAELKTKIERFRDEELEHRDIAVDYKGRETRHYKLLHDVIQTGCRTAIKIAEKI
jgi:3-demethoxyubiquinol 3-hydroxylase